MKHNKQIFICVLSSQFLTNQSPLSSFRIFSRDTRLRVPISWRVFWCRFWSLIVRLLILCLTCFFKRPPGVHGIRKASSFWQLRHQTAVYEGARSRSVTSQMITCSCCPCIDWFILCFLFNYFSSLRGELPLDRHDRVHQSGRELDTDDELASRQQPKHPVWSVPRLQGLHPNVWRSMMGSTFNMYDTNVYRFIRIFKKGNWAARGHPAFVEQSC